MLFKVGPGTSGYNSQPELLDFSCTVMLGSGVTLQQGQAVWYDMTNFTNQVPNAGGASVVGSGGQSTVGSDKVLPAPNANNARVYGIYQGPTFTAPATGVNQAANYCYDIQARRNGYGVVWCQVITGAAGSAVINVGTNLIGAANTAGLTGAFAGTAAIGTNIGIAVATGSASAQGNQIMVAGVATTKLVNAFISCT